MAYANHMWKNKLTNKDVYIVYLKGFERKTAAGGCSRFLYYSKYPKFKAKPNTLNGDFTKAQHITKEARKYVTNEVYVKLREAGVPIDTKDIEVE